MNADIITTSNHIIARVADASDEVTAFVPMPNSQDIPTSLPPMAFCPACFVEVTQEQADAQINAARVLAEFAKTAPGRLPQRVQEAIAVVQGALSGGGK